MCTSQGTIPSIDGDGNPEVCKQSVCIVNNVEFTARQSELGNISISQICTHCQSKDTCRCMIDGVNISIDNSKIEGNVKAVQELCSDTLCTVADPNNPQRTLNIPCSGPSIVYYQYQQKMRESERRNSGFTISVCILLVALVTSMIFLRLM